MFSTAWKSQKPTSLHAHGRLRWATRIVAALIAAFVVFMGVGHAIGEVGEPVSGVGIGVAIFMVIITVVMLSGWRWEFLGGAACVVTAIAFGPFVAITAGRNEIPVAIALSAPIFLVGLGFILSSRQQE